MKHSDEENSEKVAPVRPIERHLAICSSAAGVNGIVLEEVHCDHCAHWGTVTTEHWSLEHGKELLPQKSPEKDRPELRSCKALVPVVHENVSAWEGCFPEYWTPPDFGCSLFERKTRKDSRNVKQSDDQVPDGRHGPMTPLPTKPAGMPELCIGFVEQGHIVTDRPGTMSEPDARFIVEWCAAYPSVRAELERLRARDERMRALIMEAMLIPPDNDDESYYEWTHARTLRRATASPEPEGREGK